MNALCENLIDILSRQSERYDRVLEIVERERKALMDHRPSELESLVSAKEGLILEIRNLEEERLLVTLRLARFLNADPETLKTSDVIAQVDPGQGARLAAVRGALMDCMDRIGEINRINRRMCENGMALVRDVMGAVAHAAVGAAPETGGYGAACGAKRNGTPQAVGTRSWQA